jgi:hypothetical protein
MLDLVVQAAQYVALRLRVVVLHEVGVDAEFGKAVRLFQLS